MLFRNCESAEAPSQRGFVANSSHIVAVLCSADRVGDLRKTALNLFVRPEIVANRRNRKKRCTYGEI